MIADSARAKLNELRALETEHEWVEFKEAKNNFDLDKLGRYVSALANEASMAGQRAGWLVFGVHDTKRAADAAMRIIVGTTFRKSADQLNELKKLMADGTTGRLTFRAIHELEVDGKRTLLFEIPAAQPGTPVAWKGHYYGREGSSLAPLSLEELDRLRGQATDWSAEIVPGTTLSDLDLDALAEARIKFVTKNPDLRDQIASWDDRTFLNKARITRNGAITRTALLLLGSAEASQWLSGADPRITWVLKHSDGSNRDSAHFFPPFLLTTTKVAARIRNTNYQFLRDSTLFPDQITQYDPWVLRELLHNCVAHQDYALGGRITVVEHEEVLAFSNPGRFMAGSVEDRLLADAPPDRYRNAHLAQAMVALNMIDTLGNGLPKAFRLQRERGFPLPDYELEDDNRVTVRLTGRVLDENYTRTLFANSDLSLIDAVALDKVQKRKVLQDVEFKRLKAAKLIEGRRPNVYISARVAAVTGQEADYVHSKGLGDVFYRELILQLIDSFGTATPTQIQATLMRKLPDNLDDNQKRSKIRNLTQDLARDGKLVNVGKHGRGARWSKPAQR